MDADGYAAVESRVDSVLRGRRIDFESHLERDSKVFDIAVSYVPHVVDGAVTEGRTEAVALKDTPPEVIDTAIRAARLIGDGFYGVDLKAMGRGYCVIEVNDNPNVDAGNEDGVLKDALYLEVMTVFARRMAARGWRLP